MGICASCQHESQAKSVGPFAVGITRGDSVSFYGFDGGSIVRVDGTFTHLETAKIIDSEASGFKERHGMKPFGVGMMHTGDHALHMYGVQEGKIVHIKAAKHSIPFAQSVEDTGAALLMCAAAKVNEARLPLEAAKAKVQTVLYLLAELKSVDDADSTTGVESNREEWERLQQLSDEDQLCEMLQISNANDAFLEICLAMETGQRESCRQQLHKLLQPSRDQCAGLEAKLAEVHKDNVVAALEAMPSKERYMTVACMEAREQGDTLAAMDDKLRQKYMDHLSGLKSPFSFKQQYGFTPFASHIEDRAKVDFFGIHAGELVRVRRVRSEVPFGNISSKLGAVEAATVLATMSRQHRQAVLESMSDERAALIFIEVLWPAMYDDNEPGPHSLATHMTEGLTMNPSRQGKELRTLSNDDWVAFRAKWLCFPNGKSRKTVPFQDAYGFVPFGAAADGEDLVVFYGMQKSATNEQFDVVKVYQLSGEIPTVKAEGFYGFESSQ